MNTTESKWRTIEEAAGTDPYRKDLQTSELVEHTEFYGRVLDRIGGPEALIPYFPVSLDKLRAIYPNDPYFNSIPLDRWDRDAGFITYSTHCTPTRTGVTEILRRHFIHHVPCSQCVCLLKEAARILCETSVSEPASGSEIPSDN